MKIERSTINQEFYTNKNNNETKQILINKNNRIYNDVLHEGHKKETSSYCSSFFKCLVSPFNCIFNWLKGLFSNSKKSNSASDATSIPSKNPNSLVGFFKKYHSDKLLTNACEKFLSDPKLFYQVISKIYDNAVKDNKIHLTKDEFKKHLLSLSNNFESYIDSIYKDISDTKPSSVELSKKIINENLKRKSIDTLVESLIEGNYKEFIFSTTTFWNVTLMYCLDNNSKYNPLQQIKEEDFKKAYLKFISKLQPAFAV